MNCLPIVERELRVAARRRSTVWLRVGAATAALVIGAGCLILNELEQTSSPQMGRVLFFTLTWLGFAAGLGTGLFLTSDCLSEEKREGTLGLLFLTDLRGYDVTLGKLLATSLRGFYALLAILPIISVTQLMGGISHAQYWKCSLVLINALFCSLAAGMFVSALSRDSQKAMAATLLVLLLLAAGGPLADTLAAWVNKRGFRPYWSVSSPVCTLLMASAWSRSAYWLSLAVTHAVGWAMLLLASALAPYTWQERRGAAAGPGRTWSLRLKYGGKRRQARLRRKWLERQPLTWLACRERWQSLGLWIVALLILGSGALALWKIPLEAWIYWHYLGGLLTFLLYLWAASQASRFLADTRRTGLLELLLVTPLSERQIVRGQWRALFGLFGLPLALLLAAQVAAAALANVSLQRVSRQVSTMAATATTAAAAGTNAAGTNVTTSNTVFTATVTVSSGTGVSAGVSVGASTNAVGSLAAAPEPLGGQGLALLIVASLARALCTAANLVALIWFGMWMGMTSRTANLATLKTLAFVQVIPWFIIAFGTTVIGSIVMRLMAKSQPHDPGLWLLWFPLVTATVGALLATVKDLGFIIWARHRLFSALRVQAAATLGRRTPTPLVPVPPPLPAAGDSRAERLHL